jgi:hypothetical protein
MAEEGNDVTQAEETDQIKEQIEETRSQMGDTIDAIQDKLSFSNVSEQISEHVTNAVDAAKEAVYDATIGKAAMLMKEIGDGMSKNVVLKKIKQDPLPFILIGAGAGLLAYRIYAQGSEPNPKYRYVNGRSGDSEGLTKRASLAERSGEKVTDTAGKLTDTAGAAYEKVSGVVSSAYTGAGEAAGKAFDTIGGLGTAASDKYQTQIQENPLAVGAVALALGAAVGLAIPSTQYEGQLLGETRQKLIDKAENAAADLIDRTKDAVSSAAETVSAQLSSETEQ